MPTLEEKSSLPTQAESAPTTIAKQLLQSWMDRDYRAEFVRERVKSSIALQIRALREQRNQMTQTQLGDAIGMAQTWISKLEDPEYGKMTVATLLRLAEAFDTDLEVKFRPFSRALHDLSRQSADYFVVPSFDRELQAMQSYVQRGATTDVLPQITIPAAYVEQQAPPPDSLKLLPREEAQTVLMGVLSTQCALPLGHPFMGIGVQTSISMDVPSTQPASPGTIESPIGLGIHLVHKRQEPSTKRERKHWGFRRKRFIKRDPLLRQLGA